MVRYIEYDYDSWISDNLWMEGSCFSNDELDEQEMICEMYKSGKTITELSIMFDLMEDDIEDTLCKAGLHD